MSESVNEENKHHNQQKPPLSVGRIACEILAGTVAGLVVAFPLASVTGFLLSDFLHIDEVSDFAALGVLAKFTAIFTYVFPKCLTYNLKRIDMKWLEYNIIIQINMREVTHCQYIIYSLQCAGFPAGLWKIDTNMLIVR